MALYRELKSVLWVHWVHFSFFGFSGVFELIFFDFVGVDFGVGLCARMVVSPLCVLLLLYYNGLWGWCEVGPWERSNGFIMGFHVGLDVVFVWARFSGLVGCGFRVSFRRWTGNVVPTMKFGRGNPVPTIFYYMKITLLKMNNIYQI